MDGRRRDDTYSGMMPDPWPEPGDYWKLVLEDGTPVKSTEEGNLTQTVWMFCAPNGAIGTMRRHTVREHEDRTISVIAGDGSSNSILIAGWHGYIDHGVWNAC